MNELMREFLSASGFNKSLKQCPGLEDAGKKLKQFKRFKKVRVKSQMKSQN